jgi:predicted nucleic acid-binding protein
VKPIAVLDASMVIAGCGWGAEPHLCLVSLARRRFQSAASEAIIEEWREALTDTQAEGAKFRRDPWPTLNWLIANTARVLPAPLGKQRSRDAKDDPYLAAALAARAQFIVSRDPDLLDLGKPFGVEIVTPRAFLSRLHFGP